MQLLLISGIAVAIAAVLFALQNNVPVTVTFASGRTAPSAGEEIEIVGAGERSTRKATEATVSCEATSAALAQRV